jgi:hypothetical protein
MPVSGRDTRRGSGWTIRVVDERGEARKRTTDASRRRAVENVDDDRMRAGERVDRVVLVGDRTRVLATARRCE